MNTFEGQRKLHSLVTNDQQAPLTQIGTLSTLKLLKKMDDGGETFDDIIKSETKYLKGAALALKKSKLLQSRFGTGYNAAESLAGLLKLEHEERVYKAAMDRALDDSDAALGTNELKSFADLGMVFS